VTPARRNHLRQELGISESAIVVGTVARRVAEKGYRELISAARSIRARDQEIRFVAIGGSEPEKADRLQPDEIERAREDVIFTGWRRDVRDLYAMMDIFVLASWREGLPRSAIEAAAMAKPLVLTDIRGCREVGREGIEAILVPPRDADGLASAIARLADDADLRARLGTAARARAADRFDERRVVGLVAGQYRRLLAGNQVPAEAPQGSLT
jgi:glycosyltransferase involved in cell wall biosynthesis